MQKFLILLFCLLTLSISGCFLQHKPEKEDYVVDSHVERYVFDISNCTTACNSTIMNNSGTSNNTNTTYIEHKDPALVRNRKKTQEFLKKAPWVANDVWRWVKIFGSLL